MCSSRFWKLLITLTFVSFIATACASTPAAPAPTSAAAPAGEKVTISVSGAFALFPMMQVWAEEYSKLHPNVTFDVQGGGAGKGMTDMLSGAVDIAMLSREARKEELDQGSFLVPAAIDAVIPTINAKNPVAEKLLATGITPKLAAKIWMTGEITTWGQVVGTSDTTKINVYTRSDASGAGEVWSKYLGGKVQDDLKGTGVNGDPGVAEAVRQDPAGIGYNNIAFAYDLSTNKQVEGIRVIPLDVNEDGTISDAEALYTDRAVLNKAIAEKRFPYPPARLLYLVTKGKPSPAIHEFFLWMLSDGQKLVNNAGFVGLNSEYVQQGVKALQP